MGENGGGDKMTRERENGEGRIEDGKWRIERGR
jgi:hypothetical protein